MRRAVTWALRAILVLYVLATGVWLVFCEWRDSERRLMERAPVVVPSGWESRA